MFDRVTESAEKLATTVSRRAFLGRLGRSAAVLAGVLGGLCAATKLAQAGHTTGRVYCCLGSDCLPPPKSSCVIVKADCTSCEWNCKGTIYYTHCGLR